ncbi:MAG: ATP-dependent helicase HrpB [Alphaproteobacteria bacterium]|nr:ATP-dependent helicase HrpB [Alphaproteobacteria bacterium]
MLVAPLPIDEVLPRLLAALDAGGNAVLVAPPGAGKTTRLPLALLARPWLAGRRLLMLEPRRLAARAAAQRMARQLDERVGETVGYRMRADTRVGPATRIEVVTDGLFPRLLDANPGLDGFGAVLFDEFHERGLDCDLGLALALDLQAALRPDLRLVAMSATLDPAPLQRLLGDAALVLSRGRAFPVTVHHRQRPAAGRLLASVAATVGELLASGHGNLLAFLPGQGEIHSVAARLAALPLPSAVSLHPLYGDLPQAAQDAAIAPAPPGQRKIVLATAIAETSLTIEGITAVIDAGLRRVARYDPESGMAGLVTLPVTQAQAAQRAGRAGRLAPGLCVRLWSEAEHRALPMAPEAEIRIADLAPFALELAGWGVAEPMQLRWLDPPPLAAFARAQALLRQLGALDDRHRITAEGRALLRLGTHPRLAHLMRRAAALGQPSLGAQLAALLEERDPLAGQGVGADIGLRLDRLRDQASGAWRSIAVRARLLRRRLGGEDLGGEDVGSLVALAYPERVAGARGNGQFLMANGRGASLPPIDPLAGEDFLAVAAAARGAREARIHLAAPLTRADVERLFADRIVANDSVAWDDRAGAVHSRRRRWLGALLLDDAPLAAPDPAAVLAALLHGIRQRGLACLPWSPAAVNWLGRAKLLARLDGTDWPVLDDAALTDRLEFWLAPSLRGLSRLAELRALDLVPALSRLLEQRQLRRLASEAPPQFRLPSGREAMIDYASGEEPVLAVKLQELFGTAETPHIASGRQPLLLHLLSPAGRPAQITRDLAGFWRTGYAAVRRDLRGRYPKHPWPEDPLTATARAKPRGQ